MVMALPIKIYIYSRCPNKAVVVFESELHCAQIKKSILMSQYFNSMQHEWRAFRVFPNGFGKCHLRRGE
jgi:hypothetical protein